MPERPEVTVLDEVTEVAKQYSRAWRTNSDTTAQLDLPGRRSCPQRLFDVVGSVEAQPLEIQAALQQLDVAGDVFLRRGMNTLLVEAMITPGAPSLQRLAVLLLLLRHAMTCHPARALAWLQNTGQTSYTALCAASLRGYTECVGLLLRCRADPAPSDVKGNSPLLLAAEVGHTDVVKLLLEER